VLGVVIGDGYNKESFSRYGWVYSGEKSLIAELHVKYADGTEQVVGTDETWLGKRSRDLIENSIYNGETLDARNSRNWLYEDEYFSPVILGERRKEKLTPNQIPPIRVEKYIEYKDAWINKDGKVILDFGENIAGFVRVKINGKRGEKITIRHAEEIYKDTKELDFYTNRLAKATDTYILSGNGEEIFEPRFTYHGFRYAEIEGIKEIPQKDAFCAAFMHVDLERTLEFSCDDADIMKLFDNASRSMRGNSVSYPTDCTMRDERTPCIMDEVCYVKYGAHFWDTSSYVKQFIRNLIRENDGNPGWDGGQVTVLYKLYRLFGDKRAVEELYPSMLKFIEHCAKAWPDGIPDKMFGDWCAPTLDNPSADYETAFSSVKESGAALGYLQANEVREMALLLGKTDDAKWLENRMHSIKESYNRAFLSHDKKSYIGKNVVSVLPVAFGMTEDGTDEDVIRSVAEKIKSTGHLDTGIYGTRYLPTVLGKYGYLDTALDALFSKTYPGFGYQFDYGATTLWEQWYEYGNMSSHNHAMFSGSCTFIIENLMGIKDPGSAFDKLYVKPDLSARVSKMSSSLNTVRGKYEISYEKTAEKFTYKIKVPFGCEVNLEMPDGKKYTLGSGEHVAVAEI
jgi:alpha-L-rhamnosidase